MQSTASRPPNRFVSCSTRSIGSVTSRSLPPSPHVTHPKPLSQYSPPRSAPTHPAGLQEPRQCPAYAARREQRDTQHQQSERQDLIVGSHTKELRRNAQ